MPYALLNLVHIDDYDLANQSVRDGVLPRLAQLPGFESGIWCGDRDTARGFSVLLFDSRQPAEAMADRLRTGQTPPPPGVRFETTEVYEVVVQA